MTQLAAPVNRPIRRRGTRTHTNHRELRRRRHRADLTLEELAQQAGTSKGHLSKIERGMGNASRPLTLRLANVLGCSIHDLIDEGAA